MILLDMGSVALIAVLIMTRSTLSAPIFQTGFTNWKKKERSLNLNLEAAGLGTLSTAFTSATRPLTLSLSTLIFATR